jgi:hypothetical protein
MNMHTSSDVDALISSLGRTMQLVDALPNLSNDDRQELRTMTWEYYMPMLAEAQVYQSMREVATLREWYNLPSTEQFSL